MKFQSDCVSKTLLVY